MCARKVTLHVFFVHFLCHTVHGELSRDNDTNDRAVYGSQIVSAKLQNLSRLANGSGSPEGSNPDHTTWKTVTNPSDTQTNASTELPAMFCWKVPLDEECPDCHPDETWYKCFFRGLMPMLFLCVVILILLIPGCLWRYYKSLGHTIRNYQTSFVLEFTRGQTANWKRLSTTREKDTAIV